jgi:hypothetical protein
LLSPPSQLFKPEIGCGEQDVSYEQHNLRDASVFMLPSEEKGWGKRVNALSETELPQRQLQFEHQFDCQLTICCLMLAV